ncbi:hypothetical protein HN747_04800 [archaeon]|nr:hypothetical protein [archaeon]
MNLSATLSYFKRCSLCRRELPTSSFYSKGTLKGKQRFDTRCKNCILKVKKEKSRKKSSMKQKQSSKRKSNVIEICEYQIERKFLSRESIATDSAMSEWIDKVISKRMGEF